MSGLTSAAATLFGNAMRVDANSSTPINIGKLGKPIYRWEWGMTPMTINAYANPAWSRSSSRPRSCSRPSSIPMPMPAVNYGGIGAVIGHEMSHHFDDQGAKYDVHGR